MVDQKLISRCIKDDPKAFEELYKMTMPYMVVLCRRYHLRDCDIEDMLQEIYSELYFSLSKYKANEGAFLPWFRKLGIFTILKSYRKKDIKIVTIESVDHYLQADFNDHEISLTQDITSLVNKLPKGYKTIFNLAKDGLDHHEISSYLGISQSASRSQLSRAKKILRNQITSLKLQ